MATVLNAREEEVHSREGIQSSDVENVDSLKSDALRDPNLAPHFSSGRCKCVSRCSRNYTHGAIYCHKRGGGGIVTLVDKTADGDANGETSSEQESYKGVFVDPCLRDVPPQSIYGVPNPTRPLRSRMALNFESSFLEYRCILGEVAFKDRVEDR
ncbi:hypothetical protein ACFE04_021459 [Oxalis oulophora]